MKIAIIGFSGAGKSTLARKLAKFYSIPFLHLDACHFKENWQEVSTKEMTTIVSKFMKENQDWIIEGNYSKICPERFCEADEVIFLAYNRLTCLKSVITRYKTYKNSTRPDMAEGCKEKLDRKFILWVVFEGRTLKKKKKYKTFVSQGKRGIIFKNRKSLFKYLKELGVENYEASM